MVQRKKTATVQLSKIRLREELRRKLARDAERNRTTLNGEIVARLEQSYAADEQRHRENALVEILLAGTETAQLMRQLAVGVQRRPSLANKVLKIAIEGLWGSTEMPVYKEIWASKAHKEAKSDRAPAGPNRNSRFPDTVKETKS